MESIDNEFMARAAIRECIIRIARGEDRRDAHLLRGAFWSDATFDFGLQAGDLAAYLAWVVPGSAAIQTTQHLLGQSYIELDGASARAETHVLSHHRVLINDAPKDIAVGGRYLDSLAFRDNQWRVSQRVMIYEWEQDWGPAANWSKGVLGCPLSAPHFASRAQGDYSEQWFLGESP